jgi:hypothetical protein
MAGHALRWLAAGVNDIVRVGGSWECNMAVDYQTLVSALRQNDEVAKIDFLASVQRKSKR